MRRCEKVQCKKYFSRLQGLHCKIIRKIQKKKKYFAANQYIFMDLKWSMIFKGKFLIYAYV